MEDIRYPSFRWVVFFVICLASFSFQVNMLAYSPLLGEIAKDLGVHVGDAANFLAVFLVTGSISLLIGGFLIWRLGMWFTVAVGLLCTAVPAVLAPWVGHNYGAVMLMRIIQGFSVGLNICAWTAMAVRWFPPQERGRAVAIPGATQSLGGLVANLLGPAIFIRIGSWQSTMAWLASFSWIAFVLALITAFLGRKYEPVVQLETEQPAGGSSIKEALNSPLAWLGILITFLTAWMFQAFTDLSPVYLAVEKPVGIGYGPVMAGKLMMGVFIAGIIGPFITGTVIDKIFRGNFIPTLTLGFILSAVFSYIILYSSIYTHIPMLVICLALAGLSTQLLYPSIVYAVAVSYPAEIVSVMQGLWMGLGAFGGAAGVYVNGRTLAYTGSYTLALQLFLLIGALGLVLVFLMSRHLRRFS
ncbi:MAG: MFS transporter [Moorellaceae bacterium]